MKEPDIHHRSKSHEDCGHEPDCFSHHTPKGRCNCYCDPQACALCGRNERGHGMTYQPGVGMHTWVKPSLIQTLSRMRKRRRFGLDG